jgi:hypothetical protein
VESSSKIKRHACRGCSQDGFIGCGADCRRIGLGCGRDGSWGMSFGRGARPREAEGAQRAVNVALKGIVFDS